MTELEKINMEINAKQKEVDEITRMLDNARSDLRRLEKLRERIASGR